MTTIESKCGTVFDVTPVELSNEEIMDKYGDFITDALRAFASDLDYPIAMISNAQLAEWQQHVQQAKALSAKTGVQYEKILKDKGLTSRTSARRRKNGLNRT